MTMNEKRGFGLARVQFPQRHGLYGLTSVTSRHTRHTFMLRFRVGLDLSLDTMFSAR